MTDYSNSKIETFKQCKWKYKLRYVDKIQPEIKTSVEAFMGQMVHEVLFKLYDDLRKGFFNTRQRLIEFYEQKWNEEWEDNILIVKNDKKFYKNKGENFIIDYYERFKPFNQIKIVDLETEDFLELSNGNRYHIRIDKLAKNEDTYFVCDYKTNNRLKSQEEVDKDRQLAMYSLWVKEHFKDCKDIKLIWHFLAFKEDKVSERDDFSLVRLKNEIEDDIKEIEKEDNFETNPGVLCNWCEFRSICKEFN